MTGLTAYKKAFDYLSEAQVFALPRALKEQRLLPILNLLTDWHAQQSVEFQRIVQGTPSYSRHMSRIDEVPILAVRLFKLLQLRSVPSTQIYRTLQSSGTSSQVTAKVVLDKETSQRQSKVLVSILQSILGKKRLPMLIIDAPSTVSKTTSFGARAAGIQGLAFFGRSHVYALNDDMSPNWEAIDEFCENHAHGPVLIFGFTFMVWQYFVNELAKQQRSISLEHGILLHSGGWKKLESAKVSNNVFKSRLHELTGISKIHNFYGMAEQVGSVFVECSHGYLHAPNFADIVVRDPFTLQPTKNGEQGIIQVLSAIPTSYPGHSILTEDLGVLHGEDNCACGWQGKYFSVIGRLPRAEIRGCSDTHAQGTNND